MPEVAFAAGGCPAVDVQRSTKLLVGSANTIIGSVTKIYTWNTFSV